ncbi:hypothetical protein B0T21DRAFT_182221 [Apiosordaria backusii]|uniref:Secreted protein n=1 Tax=Apiosordaria backusii TaxID=314023 RepID=A0AA40ECR0_9PEZI|nr:hypothetical protein B0T21DRAFT_182221 [Apiosordaria backusii]
MAGAQFIELWCRLLLGIPIMPRPASAFPPSTRYFFHIFQVGSFDSGARAPVVKWAPPTILARLLPSDFNF